MLAVFSGPAAGRQPSHFAPSGLGIKRAWEKQVDKNQKPKLVLFYNEWKNDSDTPISPAGRFDTRRARAALNSSQLDIRVDYRLPSAPKGTPSAWLVRTLLWPSQECRPAKKEPMFILKPTLPEVFTKDEIGTIEEVVRDSRLVDKGIRELKKFSPNAPSFDPERRKFFKHAAVLAGLIASGKFLEACSPAVVEYQGKSYGGWEAWLMSQDLIRGPSPLYRPTGDLPYDNHLTRTGWYAIDYDVPIGTPIVPTANSFSVLLESTRTGGNVLLLLHALGYNSTYAHLDTYTDIVHEGKPHDRRGFPFRDQELNKSKTKNQAAISLKSKGNSTTTRLEVNTTG